VRRANNRARGSVARRARGDGGFIAGTEVLPFSVLVFILTTFLVTNAWAVIDAKLATSAAAREATRAFVEAGDTATARQAAIVAAVNSLGGAGRGASTGDVAVSGELVRCTTVTVDVTRTVHTISLPFSGFAGGPTFTVHSRHAELVDPYREAAGLTGTAPCP